MEHMIPTRVLDDAARREVTSFLDAVAADGGDTLDDHLLSDLREGSMNQPVEGFVAVVGRGPADSGTGPIVGYAQLSGGHAGVVVGCVVRPTADPGLMTDLLQALLPLVPAGCSTTWWTPGDERHEAAARTLGMSPGRRLLQMTRALPLDDAVVAATSEIITRPFRPGTDDAEWLEVNNAAFAWHGEQGGWTAEILRQRQRAPWFDNYGFLLHESDGRLDGFCWTKLHKPANPFALNASVVGEIYVIAVHPDAHGHGLGRSLTVAGLRYLQRKGATKAMLYVDADNVGAVAMYERLGFAPTRTDVAYHLEPAH
jgi:mycothiol synthase